MSQNIEQIYIANPITSNAGTDLMYFGQSPYGAGDDAAMLYSNFSAQFIPTGGAVLLNPAGNQTILNAHNLIMALGSMVAPTMLPGNLSLSGNTVSSTNSNGNIELLPNGTGKVLEGTSFVISPSSAGFEGATAGKGYTYLAAAYVNSLTGTSFGGLKSRGASIGDFTAVQANDILCTFAAYGSDGTQFSQSSTIQMLATGTISNGIVPGLMILGTANASGTMTTALTINSSQAVILANPLLPASGGLGTATAPTAGQIPIGTSGNIYTPSAINSGTGIVVANGSGSITISATGGGVAWVSISGTTQAAAVNTGYIVANAGATTISLPATCAIGDTIKVNGLGAGGWIITPAGGQTIKVLTASAGTSVASAEQYDCIELGCITANTTWAARNFTSTGLVIT